MRFWGQGHGRGESLMVIFRSLFLTCNVSLVLCEPIEWMMRYLGGCAQIDKSSTTVPFHTLGEQYKIRIVILPNDHW